MVIFDVTAGAGVDGIVVGGGVDGVVVTTPRTKCRDVIRKLECRQVCRLLFYLNTYIWYKVYSKRSRELTL